MLGSVTTKNSNWEIPTKNFVTSKSWDGVKDEKLSYFGNSRKYPSFKEGEEGHEKPTYKGRLPEMGGGSLDSLQI